MNTVKPKTVAGYVLTVAVSTLLGFGGVFAFAAGPDAGDTGANNAKSSQPKEWQIGASGQTFGSLIDVEELDQAPDLVQAATPDGKTGYVYMAELNAASGANVSTPGEALEFQKSMDVLALNGEKVFIPVYDQEGKVVIGDFEIAPSTSDYGQ